MSRTSRPGAGPQRLLLTVYAIFVIAATGRASVQIATEFENAPVAYSLSAVAAVVYILSTVALWYLAPLRAGQRRSGRTAWRWAVAACSFELLGVLVVGTLSLTDRGDFPDEAVWSAYGRGYGFIPLVLPIAGLLWLRQVRRTTAGR